MVVPFRGSVVQIITKSKIRYGGKLEKIDEASLTVTVKNVTIFGTEHRVEVDDPAFVAPFNEIIGNMTFRGCDIDIFFAYNAEPTTESGQSTDRQVPY